LDERPGHHDPDDGVAARCRSPDHGRKDRTCKATRQFVLTTSEPKIEGRHITS
jgi:hypothetical protein